MTDKKKSQGEAVDSSHFLTNIDVNNAIFTVIKIRYFDFMYVTPQSKNTLEK